MEPGGGDTVLPSRAAGNAVLSDLPLRIKARAPVGKHPVYFAGAVAVPWVAEIRVKHPVLPSVLPHGASGGRCICSEYREDEDLLDMGPGGSRGLGCDLLAGAHYLLAARPDADTDGRTVRRGDAKPYFAADIRKSVDRDYWWNVLLDLSVALPVHCGALQDDQVRSYAAHAVCCQLCGSSYADSGADGRALRGVLLVG